MKRDSFGIASWSAHTGTTEHAAAIQLAAMLTGVAGPIVELDHGEVSRPMSPLVPVLVTKGGRRPKSLEALRSTPLDMDAQLRKRFAGLNAEDLREAHGQMAKKNAGFQDPVTDANRLAAMLKVLNPGDGMVSEDSYSADWELDVTDRRLRSVLRPSFILDNPAIQELPESVAGCHDSVALLPGFRLEHLIRGGNRAFKELFGLAAGRDLTLPPLVIGKSLIKSERGEIRCILIADPSEIARALEVFPGFANRVVLVDASLPTTTCEWEESKVARFCHVYHRQVQFVADKRRRGHYLDPRPWSAAGRRARQDNSAVFLAACDAANVPCAGLEDLPSILRWVFDLIARTDTPPHEEVADIIHRLCLALLEDHCRILRTAQQRATRSQQLEFAEKIVGRISSRQPLMRRDLIRTFNNQQLERFLPVLKLLVEMGVLVEEPGNIFRLGHQRWENVRSRWLDYPALLS